MLRTAVALISLLLLAACGSASGDGASPAGGPSAGPVVAPAGTPPAAAPPPGSPVDAASGAVTDCGTFRLGQGEKLPGHAAQCIIGAVTARSPARLELTQPTVEGDPIPITYLTRADGTIEVTTDTTKDAFGPRGVERMTCTKPRFTGGTLDFASCGTPAQLT